MPRKRSSYERNNEKLDVEKENNLNLVKELSSNPRKTALKTLVLTLLRKMKKKKIFKNISIPTSQAIVNKAAMEELNKVSCKTISD